MPNISDFFQDAYPATDELQCVTLYFPAGDEFKWLLAGLLRLPAVASSYQDPDSEQAQGLADIWRDGYDLTDWEGCVLPAEVSAQGRAAFWSRTPGGYESGGFPMTVSLNTGQPYNFFAQQPTPAINDAHIHYVYLAAGSYAGRFTYVKNNNCGIVTIEAQQPSGAKVTMATVDEYQSTLALNQTVNVSMTLTESGKQVIRLKVASKNASSSNYANVYTMLELWRTA